MGQLLAAGARWARDITDLAITSVLAVAPGVGRGTRLMPIDPSVQEHLAVRQSPRVPAQTVAGPASARFEPSLDPRPRAA